MQDTTTIWEINKRRAVMKIPVTSLCAQAGISARSYQFAMAGVTTPRPDTLARLNAALARCRKAYDGDPGPASHHATYRLAMVLAALQLGEDPRSALFADPLRKATADPVWLATARVRRLAFWIANGQLGLKITEVARAAGITKQAVSAAIKELEDDEDPETRRVCRALEEVFG